MAAGKIRMSTGRLMLGVAAGWAMVIVSWGTLLLPANFDDVPRIDLRGEVTEVATPILLHKQPGLELVLRGQSVRFRIYERIFADLLQRRVPAELVPGAQVRVTVEKEDYESPRSPAPLRVPTVAVDALEVAGKPILTLAASRQWSEGNRSVWWVLAPVVSAMAAYVTVMLVRRRREERA